jgi:hypothetical protein
MVVSSTCPPEAAADSANDSDLAEMRLTGIVTEPEHDLTIFAVNGATKPLRLTEGEALSGWRIESITPAEPRPCSPSSIQTWFSNLRRSRLRRTPLPASLLSHLPGQPGQPDFGSPSGAAADSTAAGESTVMSRLLALTSGGRGGWRRRHQLR